MSCHVPSPPFFFSALETSPRVIVTDLPGLLLALPLIATDWFFALSTREAKEHRKRFYLFLIGWKNEERDERVVSSRASVLPKGSATARTATPRRVLDGEGQEVVRVPHYETSTTRERFRVWRVVSRWKGSGALRLGPVRIVRTTEDSETHTQISIVTKESTKVRVIHGVCPAKLRSLPSAFALPLSLLPSPRRFRPCHGGNKAARTLRMIDGRLRGWNHTRALLGGKRSPPHRALSVLARSLQTLSSLACGAAALPLRFGKRLAAARYTGLPRDVVRTCRHAAIVAAMRAARDWVISAPVFRRT
ncbi:hypothetical protein MRX96_008302 [Rhipicephalus microplus]